MDCWSPRPHMSPQVPTLAQITLVQVRVGPCDPAVLRGVAFASSQIRVPGFYLNSPHFPRSPDLVAFRPLTEGDGVSFLRCWDR